MRDLEFSSALHDVSSTIDGFMRRIPHKRYSLEWQYIYISVLLTIIDSMSLSKDDRRRVAKVQKRKDEDQNLVNEIYRRSRNKPAVLYNLPESMSQYVTVLSRKIMREISKDLTDCLAYFTSSNDMIEDILIKEGEIGDED